MYAKTVASIEATSRAQECVSLRSTLIDEIAVVSSPLQRRTARHEQRQRRMRPRFQVDQGRRQVDKRWEQDLDAHDGATDCATTARVAGGSRLAHGSASVRRTASSTAVIP